MFGEVCRCIVVLLRCYAILVFRTAVTLRHADTGIVPQVLGFVLTATIVLIQGTAKPGYFIETYVAVCAPSLLQICCCKIEWAHFSHAGCFTRCNSREVSSVRVSSWCSKPKTRNFTPAYFAYFANGFRLTELDSLASTCPRTANSDPAVAPLAQRLQSYICSAVLVSCVYPLLMLRLLRLWNVHLQFLTISAMLNKRVGF